MQKGFTTKQSIYSLAAGSLKLPEIVILSFLFLHRVREDWLLSLTSDFEADKLQFPLITLSDCKTTKGGGVSDNRKIKMEGQT